MAAKKILVTLGTLADRPAPYLARLEAAGFEVERNRLGRGLTEDELVESLDGVFATIAGGERYTEKVFAGARDLRVIARWGVGYDMVDVPAATRHGVTVAMAFGAGHEAVADGAFSLMAAAAHDLINKHQRVAAGGWGSGFHYGLWGRTVGVIGLGRIGLAFARRCHRGFDMQVLGFDPLTDPEIAARENVRMVDLKTLLAESDFVSLHAPATPDTDKLINDRTLALMKPTAVLVNTARGTLIDEDALYRALKSDRIAAAALDVYRVEPPAGSPLLNLSNVVLSPHATSADLTAEERTAARCIESILAIAEGRDPGREFILNPETLNS